MLAAQPTDEDDYSLFDLITIDSNWDQVKEKLGKTRKAEGAGLTRHDFLLAYVLDIEAREVVRQAGGKS